MSPVIVYTKPGCVQCNATYRALDKEGIPYNSVDVTQDAEAFQMLSDMGVKQMPVVMTSDDHWTGFNPSKIKEYKAAATA